MLIFMQADVISMNEMKRNLFLLILKAFSPDVLRHPFGINQASK